MKNSYLNLLGLAYRARMCSLGEDGIVKDIQQRKAKLVLIASDIGPQTYKKITDKCKSSNIPYVVLPENRDALSHAIGKTGRVAVAILDQGFATKMQSLLGYD